MHDPTHLTVRQDWHNAPRRDEPALTWDQAAERCQALYPGLDNLTTPMQGALIGAYLDHHRDPTDHRPDVPLASFEETLEEITRLHLIHTDWGFEK
jgi:hypothetical protein